MSKDTSLWDDPNLPSVRATEHNRDRMRTYGHPGPIFEMHARMVSALLGIEISPEESAVIMILLKVCREHCADYDAGYPDNVEDICGFANVLYVIKESDGPEHTSS